MIYALIFVVLGAFSYRYFRHSFIPKEVRENAADFDADGANDTLQRGYHGRELWSRVWPALACCVVPTLPLYLPLSLGEGGSTWAPVLGFLAMAVLLTGSFARWFTPLLNEARTATRPDVTTWYASPDSKSWPDAAVFKPLRAKYPTADNATLQPAANLALQALLTRTWRYCRITAALLSLGAVAVAVLHS